MQHYLGKVIEVYITNECNLTCSNCNRFNNYNFTGHYSWWNQNVALTAWSKRITADTITIIGGEPTLHPELDTWIRRLSKLWPESNISIQTNGVIPLDAKKYNKPGRSTGRTVGPAIAIHDDGMIPRIKRNHSFRDINEMSFDATMFTDCALIDRGDNFVLHNSDPEPAFNACAMKHSHTLLDGKLYRCPVVAVLPEFMKQYDVDASEEQKNILTQYQSLSHECDDADLIDFINSRDHHMPQCTLCPEDFNQTKVTFDRARKTRIKKEVK